MQQSHNMDLFEVGEKADFAKTISEYDVYGFAGIVGDYHASHVNEEYAKKTQYGKRIAHGALSIGFIANVMGSIANRVPPPGAVSYRYDIIFKAPVFLGDTVTAQLVLREKNDALGICIFDATVTNQNGIIVTGGSTYLRVL